MAHKDYFKRVDSYLARESKIREQEIECFDTLNLAKKVRNSLPTILAERKKELDIATTEKYPDFEYINRLRKIIINLETSISR
ncbi:MAG: hypothetical protein J6R99_02035 [Alphaproteobacteria bacterium]|nr:hypothetical protein [Alphaproteobacteria bacterium]